MTTRTTTFTVDGTFTASAYLLTGAIGFDAYGGRGANNPNDPVFGPLGGGGRVYGALAISAGGSLVIKVGAAGFFNGGGVGYQKGGDSGGSGVQGGGGGGGSSAILTGSTPLVIAAGGGGAGGIGSGAPSGNQSAGAGGQGGMPGGTGIPGTAFGVPGPGTGAVWGSPGAGGAGADGGGNGVAGTTTHGGAGGSGATEGGGGGGGGVEGGGGGGGYSGGFGPAAGGGGGGVSWWDGTVLIPNYANGVSFSDGFVRITQTYADPPLVPTLVGPANGSRIDSNAVGVTFVWDDNPGTDSGTENAYCFRIKQDTGAYQYWNAGTGLLQSLLVWNTSTSQTLTIPAGILPDAHTYNWSVATQEAHYNLQGPFATDSTFIAQAMPTAVVVTPSGSVATSGPLVTWTETLGGGLAQTNYRVIIYTAAEVAAPGFTPGSPPDLYDSGVVTSAALSHSVPNGTIPNGTSCVVYLQVTETGPISSNWATSAFTVAFDAPATPVLTAVASTDLITGCPLVDLSVVENDNLLVAADASFEGSIGGWTTAAGATLAFSATESEDATDSLKVTGTATGTPLIQSSKTYPVIAGHSYSAMLSSFPGSTIKSVAVGIAWFDSTGTPLSVTYGSTVAEVAATWTKAVVTNVAAPTSAAFAAVVYQVPVVNTEVHYVDEVGLFNGSVTAWSAGGYVGAVTAEIEVSPDGQQWSDVRGASALLVDTTQQVTAWDAEAPFGINLFYRARLTGTISNQPVSSNWSGIQMAFLTSHQWWMQIPELGLTYALALHRAQSSSSASTGFTTVSLQLNEPEVQGAFYGAGARTAVVRRGAIRAESFTLTMTFLTQAEYDIFCAIRREQKTIVLRSDMAGQRYYMALGADRPAMLARSSDRTRNPLWQVAMACTPVPGGDVWAFSSSLHPFAVDLDGGTPFDLLFTDRDGGGV